MHNTAYYLYFYINNVLVDKIIISWDHCDIAKNSILSYNVNTYKVCLY